MPVEMLFVHICEVIKIMIVTYSLKHRPASHSVASHICSDTDKTNMYFPRYNPSHIIYWQPQLSYKKPWQEGLQCVCCKHEKGSEEHVSELAEIWVMQE